jgi:hypothetical protein
MKLKNTSEVAMQWNFKDLIDDAIDDFEDVINDNSGEDPVDLMHEIADASVPVMTYDILQYACHNITLATEKPEIIAFNGESNGVNCIAGRMYEIIFDKLTERFEEMEGE